MIGPDQLEGVQEGSAELLGEPLAQELVNLEKEIEVVLDVHEEAGEIEIDEIAQLWMGEQRMK